MPEEASDFAKATVKRFKLDKLTSEKKSFKEVLERRDNEEVLRHLKATPGDKREENYRVFTFYFFKVWYQRLLFSMQCSS